MKGGIAGKCDQEKSFEMLKSSIFNYGLESTYWSLITREGEWRWTTQMQDF